MMKRKWICRLITAVLSLVLMFLLVIPANAHAKYSTDVETDWCITVKGSLQGHNCFDSDYFRTAYATLRWDPNYESQADRHPYIYMSISLKVWSSITLVQTFNGGDEVTEGNYTYVGVTSNTYVTADEVDYLRADFEAYSPSQEMTFDIPYLCMHASDYLETTE